MSEERSSNGIGLWPWSQTKPDVIRWARMLKILRFVGQIGGRAEDEDRFLAVVRVHGIEELRSVLASLGISLKHNPNPPRPISGKGYPSEEFDKFPVMIKGFANEYEQPRWTQIKGGNQLYCNVLAIEKSALIEFIVSGPSKEFPYFKGDVDMQRIVEIDRVLQGSSLAFIDPPHKSNKCVCPANFPEIWE